MMRTVKLRKIINGWLKKWKDSSKKTRYCAEWSANNDFYLYYFTSDHASSYIPINWPTDHMKTPLLYKVHSNLLWCFTLQKQAYNQCHFRFPCFFGWLFAVSYDSAPMSPSIHALTLKQFCWYVLTEKGRMRKKKEGLLRRRCWAVEDS